MVSMKGSADDSRAGDAASLALVVGTGRFGMDPSPKETSLHKCHESHKYNKAQKYFRR